MFATVEEVEELTGFIVSNQLIRRAQAIVETAAGRTEERVIEQNSADVPPNSSDDLSWLRYATAWQAAYMDNDPKAVFEQANVASVSQGESKLTFDGRLYALAPLAAEAINRLSWRRSRSVHTGPLNPKPQPEPWACA